MSGKSNPEYFYIAYLTEKRQVGESTKRSPQHLTLVPPFKNEGQIANLKKAIHEVTADIRAFQVKVGREAKFGPSRNIDVRLIEPVKVVRMLHYQLMYKLESLGVTLPAKYVYESYVPHIAVKPAHTSKLSKGQMLSVDHLALLHKSKGHRTLVAKEELVND